MPFVKVALGVPIPTLFDYCCEGATPSHVGARVLVPFGRKQAVGVVLEVGTTPSVEVARIRPVTRLLPGTPPLPEDIIALLRFCSEYYHHPIGEVVLSALPSSYRSVRYAPRSEAANIVITPEGRKAFREIELKRSSIQRRVLAQLASGGRIAPESIPRLAPADRRALKHMIERGWAVKQPVPTHDLPRSSTDAAGMRLTAEQQEAVRTLTDCAPGFQAWLLHGITGSGKTEVYLRAMATVLRASKQVLFLVPEIGLTPQLEARIRDRFRDQRLVTMHSALAAGERAANWVAAQTGEARIVLGTRSAVFVPLPSLGLVIVDEEHDTSFKQIETMRYSARDLAIWRARQRNVRVILGSATPSLETYHGALSGRYGIVRLTERANANPTPQIGIVSISGSRLVEGFAPRLIEAIHDRIARHEQVLVYINRRGYAPVLICSACGWAPGCLRCSARLVLHKARPRMVCHHCGHVEEIPAACVDCGDVDLRPLGYGTQRIEVALRSACPTARVLRVDRDTTRGRGTWNEMRESIERREVDLLIGTQLLSKGHDFAGLGLVCVLNADRSLYSTDFRASEQLFAQLMQVAGRAGRGASAGEVLIQTAFPAHPLYRAVQAHDYDAFARTLLLERKQAGFPPFVHQAVLRAEAVHLLHALNFLAQAVIASASIADRVTVFDPAPAPMQRLKGRERAQLLVQSASRSSLHRFLGRWTAALRSLKHSRTHWAIDVDPIDV